MRYWLNRTILQCLSSERRTGDRLIVQERISQISAGDREQVLIGVKMGTTQRTLGKIYLVRGDTAPVIPDRDLAWDALIVQNELAELAASHGRPAAWSKPGA